MESGTQKTAYVAAMLLNPKENCRRQEKLVGEEEWEVGSWEAGEGRYPKGKQ